MKKNLLFLAAFVINLLNAQNLNWNWAMNTGAVGSALATHTSGNVYVAGYYTSSTSIGSTTLTSNLSFDSDLYIAKISSGGSVAWAQSVGSTNMVGDRYVHGIAVDNSGNAFIAGVFSANMIFGTTTLTGTGTQNMFVAKYDNNGNFQWARRVNGICQSRDVAVDSQGNVVVTGYFTGTVTAETHTLTATTGIGQPADIFVMKYDASGNYLWGQRAGNSGSDMAFEVETDATDNIYIGGYITSGAATFGTLTVNTGSTISSQRAFYAKYNSNGDAICVKSLGSLGSTYAPMECYKLAFTGTNDIVLLGSFSGTFAIASSSLISNGLSESFVCKLANDNTTSHNSFDWISTYGGTGVDVGDFTSNIIVNNNSIYIGSSLYNNLTVGTTTITGDVEDAFVLNMDLNGNFNWAEKFGGTSGDRVQGMGYIGSDIFVSGIISNTVLGSSNLVYGGFAAKLAAGGPTGLGEVFALKSTFQFYPNPSDGQFNIIVKSERTIQVFDLNGKLMGEYLLNEGVNKLNLQMADGVYIMKDTFSGETQKLVIQNH
jgi:hypothetical protein